MTHVPRKDRRFSPEAMESKAGSLHRRSYEMTPSQRFAASSPDQVTVSVRSPAMVTEAGSGVIVALPALAGPTTKLVREHPAPPRGVA